MVDSPADEAPLTAADLREHLVECGACCVGFADVSDVPRAQELGYGRAVSIGVALRPESILLLRQAGQRPAEADAPTYAALAELARIAVRFLQQAGARAEPLTAPADTEPSLTHEETAVRAGVAWIGKTSRPVNWEFGSAVRFTTVLTDADLPLDKPTTKSFCGTCLVCTQACAAHAPSGVAWRVGLPIEEFFNSDACRERRQELARRGLDCRYCMSVCPYTLVYLGNCGVEPPPEPPQE